MHEPTTTERLQQVDELSPERRALLAQLLQKRANDNKPMATVEGVRPPAIVPAPADRYQPFPLSELQQAYWIGRIGAFQVGNVASHCYLELEADFDVGRLEDAWRHLIARHDMLRAVALADGLQQVLESAPPYVIEVVDLRGRAPASPSSALPLNWSWCAADRLCRSGPHPRPAPWRR